MRLLAISFMLPPMLYPQAIQIGRLLEGCDLELATLSGRFDGGGNGARGRDFRASQRFMRRLELPHRVRLQGMAHRFAMRLVPFYGRSPDEFTDWSRRAAIVAGDWLTAEPGAVDLIASFGEPMSDHLVGLELKRRTGLPWLAHFSDPWADNPFRALQPLANLTNRALEAAVVEAADSVVFTSEETRQLVMRKYPRDWLTKAVVLPHSFDPADFTAPTSVPPTEDVILRYLGNFYGHRTPFPLFSALARLARTHPDLLTGVRVELVGTMSAWMRWHPALRQLPKGLLRFRAPVPYLRSLELMRETDLLLVIDAPAKESVFLPSKLIDYIGAAQPIFGIVPPGASRRLIERLGGLTADPMDSQEIERLLTVAIENARALKTAERPWGNEAVRSEFEIERVAGQFRQILNETISRTSI